MVRQTVVGTGVQAYTDNDPSLVGARLRLARGDAVWLGSADPLTGTCEEAYFDSETSGVSAEWSEPLGRVGASASGARQLRFLCMGVASKWGPSEEELSLTLLKDGRIAMSWFDNLLLVLEQAG